MSNVSRGRVRHRTCLRRDWCSRRLNRSKSKQDCGGISNTLSSLLPRHMLHARTLERLSSQLESLIVRTEFCHTRINRTLLGTIYGERLEGKTMSRNGGGAEEMLALRSSMPRQVEWLLEWRRLCSAASSEARRLEGRAEQRHRLDSGAPGRLGRSVCTIMHGDYELSVGFKRVLGEQSSLLYGGRCDDRNYMALSLDKRR